MKLRDATHERANVCAWMASHWPRGARAVKRGVDSTSIVRALVVKSESGWVRGAVVFTDWWPERGSVEITALGLEQDWLTPTIVMGVLDAAFERPLRARVLVARVWDGVSNHRAVERLARAVDARAARMEDLGLTMWTVTRERVMESDFAARLARASERRELRSRDVADGLA